MEGGGSGSCWAGEDGEFEEADTLMPGESGAGQAVAEDDVGGEVSAKTCEGS